MSHANIVFIPEDIRRYDTWTGIGWYFFDPSDRSRTNIEGPYQTEEIAEREYYAYCSAVGGP